MSCAIYEEIKKSDRINSAERACYVERNYWMIDNSDYIIFYYKIKTSNERNGTGLVFSYVQNAKGKKNFKIINLKEN